MAFAAQLNTLPDALWWLYAANLLWTIAYDTKYAMVDRADDLAVGIKSTAILFGRHDVLVIALLMGVMLTLLAAAGWRLGLAWPWFAAVAVAAVLFARQLFSIRMREPAACFRAFLENNWVGCSLFVGLLLHFVISGTYSG